MDPVQNAAGHHEEAVPHRVQAVFGAAVGVVEHGVPSAQHHVHALAHGHRLEHLHHLLVGAAQHAGLVDVHQDVGWGQTETESQSVSGPTGSGSTGQSASFCFQEGLVVGTESLHSDLFTDLVFVLCQYFQQDNGT